MKKSKHWNFIAKFFALSLVGALLVLPSCKEDEPAPVADDAVASFQFAVSETNFLEVSFTNFSQNDVSWAWDFGDDGTSTEENPTHAYAGPGTYTVTLVVKNSDGKESAPKSETVTITDPNLALKLLTGEVSKDWKLYREGVALEVGPSPENPSGWFAGKNDGQRPCIYDDTWTFHFDGTLDYDDANSFWGEYGIWGTNSAENPLFESCFEPTAANMTINGNDVSAWGSGSHTFDYAVADGELTLNGTGAWIVVPNLGTDSNYPVDAFPSSVTVPISIEEFDGYDLLTVTFDHGTQGFRRATYVSYDDWADEPALAEGTPPCELDVVTGAMGHTFESASSFTQLGYIGGASVITPGATDPAGGATAVGEFTRNTTNDYQEAMIRVSETGSDFDLSTLSTISIDVYFPSTNDYSGSLTKVLALGFADQSCVPQWWTDVNQWITDGAPAEDTWVTYTYNLDDATANNPKGRAGLDMIFINIGSGGHLNGGTFYVRNLTIQ